MRLVSWGRPALTVDLEVLERQDFQEEQEPRVSLDHQDLRDFPVLRVPRVYRVHQGSQDQRVRLVLSVM